MLEITKKEVVAQLLLILTLVSASASLNHQCSNNCYSCSSRYGCGECYERKTMIVRQDGVEKEVCSSEPAPASDPCLLDYGEGCYICKPGFALRANATSPCVKGIIKDCRLEVISGTQHFCAFCLGGYPSRDQSKCLPAKQVNNPIAFCSIGALDAKDRSLGCAQCETGYISLFKKCVKKTASGSMQGCLLFYDGGCQRCDVHNGYFMRDQGRCSKNGSN